jgi:hypothetical protein
MARQSARVSSVTIEWDDARHNQAKRNMPRVRDGGKRDIPRSKNNDDEFIPKRIVIDLKLDLGDASVPEVTLDNVHLKIAYSGKEPTIGWWNGARWVTFRQVVYANGVADVTLPSPWPTDPVVGCNP